MLIAGQPVPSVALLGHGHWGRNLARNLDALGALVAVHDPDPAARADAARRYPRARVVDDVGPLLEDPSIAAVVVAAPSAQHAPLALRALGAGKDVLVEKPLALRVADGEALRDEAGRRGRVLMVGHVLEYHPAIVRLRELVAAGAVGKLRYVYSNRLNLGRIRTEENALWSFAPHDVQVLLRLLEEAPVDVSCRGVGYVVRGTADVTVSTLAFASGVHAHVFVSWLHPFKEHKLVVIGDAGMLVFDDTLSAGRLQRYPHRVEWIDRRPVAIRCDAEPIEVAADEPLALECRHFLECVVTRTRPRTDGDDGVAVLRVLEACQRSLEQGGRSVALDVPAAARAWIHDTAVVDAGAEIGAGTRVWHFSHVMGGARIGRSCVLGQNVFVGGGATIGDRVKIQNNVSVYDGVTLEDDVFCGPSVVFTNVATPRSHVSRRNELRPTTARRGATFGANATVVCGHVVGRYAFVGAGAVVTADVPDHALVLGNPARIAGWMCACGVRLPLGIDGGRERQACPACGAVYERHGRAVAPVAEAGSRDPA